MKTSRTFHLSNDHLANLAVENRSRSLALILAKTIINPHRVLDALHQRLSGHQGKGSDTTRICVTLPITVATGLDELTDKLSIATENIVRLSIEAEALNLDGDSDTRWEPHQRRNHRESAGHLQPHAEGGIDP